LTRAPGSSAIDNIPLLSSRIQPNSPVSMPNFPTQSRRVNSISMKASMLAMREPWSFRATPISGTRARLTRGLRSRHNSLMKLNGKSSPFKSFVSSLMSGMVSMKATGSPSTSAMRTSSLKMIGFSFFPA